MTQAYDTGGLGVVGSNPAAPTKFLKAFQPVIISIPFRPFRGLHLGLHFCTRSVLPPMVRMASWHTRNQPPEPTLAGRALTGSLEFAALFLIASLVRIAASRACSILRASSLAKAASAISPVVAM